MTDKLNNSQTVQKTTEYLKPAFIIRNFQQYLLYFFMVNFYLILEPKQIFSLIFWIQWAHQEKMQTPDLLPQTKQSNILLGI